MQIGPPPPDNCPEFDWVRDPADANHTRWLLIEFGKDGNQSVVGWLDEATRLFWLACKLDWNEDMTGSGKSEPKQWSASAQLKDVQRFGRGMSRVSWFFEGKGAF